jgi:hypothetical protein
LIFWELSKIYSFLKKNLVARKDIATGNKQIEL